MYPWCYRRNTGCSRGVPDKLSKLTGLLNLSVLYHDLHHNQPLRYYLSFYLKPHHIHTCLQVVDIDAGIAAGEAGLIEQAGIQVVDAEITKARRLSYRRRALFVYPSVPADTDRLRKPSICLRC